MEGMVWGIASMVFKDALKGPYLKGRDYERNVRQVYRDVDNLKITVQHIRANCEGEDLERGPYAPFIKRAERQLKESYRTLRKKYPRKADMTKLLEHAATPGAEMHLLDIGKEANQTAKGLNDLLSEVRFAKLGKKDEAEASPKPSPGAVSPPSVYSMGRSTYENAISDSSSSSRSVVSEYDGRFDRALVRTTTGPSYTPASSMSGRSRKHSSSSSPSRRPRSHSTSAYRPDRHHTSRSSSSASHNRRRPSSPTRPSSRSNFHRLDAIIESGAEREQALDNLQVGIDKVLAAPDEEHEAEAMEYMEHALAEVLRLQQTKGFAGGSQADEDLGDAVEDLDLAMTALLEAESEKEKKHAFRRVGHALEDVDRALAERQRHKERVAKHRIRQIVANQEDSSRPSRESRRIVPQLVDPKLKSENRLQDLLDDQESTQEKQPLPRLVDPRSEKTLKELLDQEDERRLPQLVPQESPVLKPRSTNPPTRGSLRRQNTSEGGKVRRYSMHK